MRLKMFTTYIVNISLIIQNFQKTKPIPVNVGNVGSGVVEGVGSVGLTGSVEIEGVEDGVVLLQLQLLPPLGTLHPPFGQLQLSFPLLQRQLFPSHIQLFVAVADRDSD